MTENITREDLRPAQIQYQLMTAMLSLGEEWDSAEDAPLHVPVALEHIETAMNLLSDPEATVSEAQPSDPEWPVTFRHKNPELSRAASIDRTMVAWEYDSLKELFEGNTDYCLLAEVADNRALFFWEDGEHWLFTTYPSGPWEQAMPEAIIDWIGAAAPKEPGAEPLLVHRDELSASLTAPIERVQDGEEHVHEQFA